MKVFDLNKLNQAEFVKVPQEVMKDITGGCVFYKHFSSICVSEFLHNRRDKCPEYMCLNITGNYKKKYHHPNDFCTGFTW